MKINYAKAYATLLKLYNEIPYRYFPGYSLPPLHYFLGLTYDCNIDCTFCFEGRKDRLKEPELTLDEIKRILDQVPFFGIMTYSGGEPFMHRDIEEIIDYSAKKCKFTIATNGTYNIEKNARMIVDKGMKTVFHNGFLEIAVSLLGMEELHDKMVQMKSAFKKSVGGLKRIRHFRDQAKKQFPLISVRVTITEENIHELHKLVDISNEVGADICMFSILNMQDKVYNPMPIEGFRAKFFQRPKEPPYIPENDLRKAFDLIREAAQKGNAIIRFNPIGITEDEIVKYYSPKASLKNFTCRQPWQKLMIQPNGDPMPCVMVKVGNLRHDSVKDIWNRKTLREFRKALKEQGVFPICFGCCGLTYQPSNKKRAPQEIARPAMTESALTMK